MKLTQQSKRGFVALSLAFFLSMASKNIQVPMLGVSVDFLSGLCVGLSIVLFLLAIVLFVKPVKANK